jgi:anthranilate synthase/aminodeoxychorismate synthase-like glutamine amidotransferase
MDIVFIDHYDSFSFNVKEWIQAHLPKSVSLTHIYCDDAKSILALTSSPRPLVLSPGPGHPVNALTSLSLAKAWLGRAPILGICLGHQILGVIGGGIIEKSKDPFHGSLRKVTLTGDLFDLNSGTVLQMGVYHSLVIKDGTLLPPWQVIGYDGLGEIAAIELSSSALHRENLSSCEKFWPAVGLQFHPESFLSVESSPIIRGWIHRDVIPWLTQVS